MFEVFEHYIGQMLLNVTEEEITLIRSRCATKKLRKKEMLLREGEVSRYKIFVAKGLLRNYSIGEKGNEYIMSFADVNSWTTDPESYYSGLPSKYNIDAVEASEVILFQHDDFEILKNQILSLNACVEMVMTARTALTQKRVLMNISATAEEKYRDFIQTYTGIFNRVPLHMVASYLGVSRETLTRIRQRLAVHPKGLLQK